MKQLIPVLLMTIIVSPAIQAESGRRGPNIDLLTQELKLSDEQVSAVQQVFDEQRERAMSLYGSGGRLDRSQKQALREEAHQKLAEILTEEQLARMEELKSRRGGRR